MVWQGCRMSRLTQRAIGSRHARVACSLQSREVAQVLGPSRGDLRHGPYTSPACLLQAARPLQTLRRLGPPKRPDLHYGTVDRIGHQPWRSYQM